MVYPDLFNLIIDNTYPRTLKDGKPYPDHHSMEDLLEHVENCYGDEVTKHVIIGSDVENCILVILPMKLELGEAEIFLTDVYDGREGKFYARQTREGSGFGTLIASALLQVYHQQTQWCE